MQTPILILSDAPDTQTGLGRITRDLAFVLAEMPEFRVGTFGRGGLGSKHLPWAQYVFPDSEQWGESLLIKACEDFAGNDPFIIFTIWDASRLFWFGHPESLPEGHPLTNFLTTAKFQRWGYFPIDASGYQGKLSILSRNTLLGYDRILAYSKFGRDTIRRTVEPFMDWEPDYIPHGIHQDTFYDHGKEAGREVLGFGPEHKVVGCVMTNQARKDWGVWAQMARHLINMDPNYRFWVHIDLLERYWSLNALVEDFGLQDYVKVTQSVNDIRLAELYSACNVTVLPSLGEGFGYPIVESLACGVPVVHVDYAGGPELITGRGLVDPDSFRLDTLHNLYRPVLDPMSFAIQTQAVVKEERPREELRASVEHLFWSNLKPLWQNWFRKGLNANP